jgi:hypothetical protein
MTDETTAAIEFIEKYEYGNYDSYEENRFINDIALVCKQARLAQRYREALEFYADKSNWNTVAVLGGSSEHDVYTMKDRGAIAREALGE